MRHHRVGLTRALRQQDWDDASIETFMDEVEAHATADAPPPSRADARMRAMIAYSLKLTHEPSKMVREDIEPLRAAGLDDQALLELNQVVAYFAYVNRVIDGLGVQLESFHTDDTG